MLRAVEESDGENPSTTLKVSPLVCSRYRAFFNHRLLFPAALTVSDDSFNLLSNFGRPFFPHIGVHTFDQKPQGQ